MIRKILIVPLIFFILLAGCVAEQAPEKGTIQFTSSPTGAQVYLDNQFRGTTPSTLSGIDPGSHTVEFRYTGYESWSATMVVSAGSNNVFVALTPKSGVSTPGGVTTAAPVSTVSPVSVTLKLDKELMTIGESMTFSGTAEGCRQVLLTIYGTGTYQNGVSLSPPDVGTLGTWSYTWNPGSKILSGTYTIVATDPEKKVTVKKEFPVLGGGEVTVTTNTRSAARGNVLQFSGLCTTGAPNVRLVLYGPERYASGIELGILPVKADKNWNFAYTLDTTMPTGTYTMYVYDIPKTSSGTTQFTVGFTQ